MKKYLSYCLSSFLLSLVLLTGSVSTYASHIVGMDMYYTYVSGNTYQITVVAFGDCGPSSATAFASLPVSTPIVCIYNGNTYVTSITLAITAPTAGVEITPVCPGVATQCTDPASAIPGIKKFVYTGTYTLPSTSTAWRFVFTGDMGTAGAITGRAAAITNILPGTTTELIDTLNNSVYNSSSPILTVVPTPFFCLNNSDGYNPGAVDAAGDSLSFSLVPGINGDGTDCLLGAAVSYNPPYTGANPLGVRAGSFSLNAATGQILFYPNILQRALVVYNIEEYHAGVLVGTCQREMTFLVQTCTNPPPGGILSSASAGTLVDSTDFRICAGTGPFSIFMNPTEPDPANNITVSATGLPAGATFATVNNGTNHPNCTFSWTTAGVAPGTYVFYVTFTDNNCPINGSQTRSYTVNILPMPTILASGAATVCPGTASTLTGSGGVSYVWSPGTGLSCTSCTSPIAIPAATTLYTVTGKNANGCTNTDTVRITVNPLPTITAGAPVTICPGGSTTLTPTGGVSYVWTPGTGLSCTSCTSPIASPTATTLYAVIGTGTDGCKNTSSVTITVDVPTISAGPGATICLGGTTILSPSGGVSYVWSPGTGLSCTACTSPVASPAATTIYEVTGTDALGCHNINTVTISIDIPAISAGAPIILCPGQSASLLPSGGVSYVWSPGTGLSCTSCTSPVASPAATTVYTVTGTDALGCHNTGSVMVSRLAALPVTAPGIAICAGSSGTLTASGASTYTWSPATGLSCTNCPVTTANPAATATYTVVGSNGTCTGTTTVTVTVNPLPMIVASGAATVCIGNPTPLSATGGVSYTWAPATGLSCISCTSPSATPSGTTAYIVTGTDANGCQNNGSVIVTINPLPVISAGAPASICAGSGYTTTLSPSGGVSYTWSPGAGLSCTSCTSPIASPAATTVYTVTGTDANGCQNTATVVITRLTPVVVTAAPVAVCLGSSGTVIASGATSYTWFPAATLSCSTCPNPSASPTITTTYTIAGVLGACADTATVTVTVNPLPVISVTGGATRCVGNPDLLTASGGSLYSWAPTTALSCFTCVTANATPAVTTTYTVTGYSSFGCAGTGRATVFINPLPVLTATPGTICFGSDVTLTAGGAMSYTWSPATGLSTSVGASVTASPDSTITYTVTGTDVHGCVNTITDPVVVNPIPPAPMVVSPVTYCQNVTPAPLVATGLPGADLLWYTSPSEAGVSTATTPVPQTAVQGTTVYYVSQTVNGCQGPMDSIAVTIFVNAVTAFNVNIKYGCLFDTLSLTNNSQYVTSYLWSFGDGTFDTVTNPTHYYAAVKDSTTYIIKLNGYIPSCYSDSTSDTITLGPTPKPFTLTNITSSQTIEYGASVQLNVDGAYIYYWIPNDGTLNNPNINDPIATPTRDTTYTVYGMNKNGCLDSASVHIDVTWDQESIPSAFSPNGDGVNDHFRVVNMEYGKLLNMSIYNRWGQLVCYTTDNTKGWDGTFNGVPQDMDVYNYMIIVAHLDGTTKLYKGTLTLLR